MNINGSTHSNGNNAVVACGGQTINLSVPTVVTDPVQAVTYTWVYPSGWNGPATSTSPNVTATASAGGQGQIKVFAQRSDGGCTTTITVNVSRPLPVINALSFGGPGNALFCNTSDTKTASATGTNATSFLWTPSGGVKINGQTSPQNTTGPVSISTTGGGSFTVRASSSSCGTSSTNSIYQAVYYGTPTVSSATVNGNPYSGSAYINNPALLQIFPGFTYNASCSWSVIGGNGSVYPSNLNADAYAYSFVAIQGVLSNGCGSGANQTFYLFQNGSSAYAVAPNPATDRQVRVTFADKLIAQEIVESLTLYSEKREVIASLSGDALKAETAKMQREELILDASKAKPGIYYLHIAMGDEVFKERVVLE